MIEYLAWYFYSDYSYKRSRGCGLSGSWSPVAAPPLPPPPRQYGTDKFKKSPHLDSDPNLAKLSN